MRREAPVRFLGGGGSAMHCCYPTKAKQLKFKKERHGNRLASLTSIVRQT